MSYSAFMPAVVYSIYGIVGMWFCDGMLLAMNARDYKISRVGLSVIFIIFNCSVYLLYKVEYFKPSEFDIVYYLLLSAMGGFIWTLLFLVGAKFMGKPVTNPRYGKMVTLFSGVALSIYIVSKVVPSVKFILF